MHTHLWHSAGMPRRLQGALTTCTRAVSDQILSNALGYASLKLSALLLQAKKWADWYAIIYISITDTFQHTHTPYTILEAPYSSRGFLGCFQAGLGFHVSRLGTPNLPWMNLGPVVSRLLLYVYTGSTRAAKSEQQCWQEQGNWTPLPLFPEVLFLLLYTSFFSGSEDPGNNGR